MKKIGNKFYAQVEKLSKIIFRGFGLFPVSIDTQHVNSNLSDIILKCWSLFILFLATINISTIVKYKEEIFDNTSIGIINDSLKFAAVLVAVYVIIIETLVNSEKFKNVYRKLHSFDDKCKSLHVNLKRYRVKMTKVFGIQFIFISLIQVFVETFVFFNIEWTEFWSANIFLVTLCRMRHLQYVYFLHLIRSRIAILRDELAKIVHQSHRRVLSYENSLQEETLDRLQIIKTAHGILWGLTFEINDIFTWSLTANLVQNFLQIGCDSYWAYLFSYKYPDQREFKLLILCFLTVLPLTQIFMVLYEANTIKVEASKLPVQLHTIRKIKSETELYKLVRITLKFLITIFFFLPFKSFKIIHFSLQTVHEKIEMRAKSFFDINNRLLISILSGITTYMVCD